MTNTTHAFPFDILEEVFHTLCAEPRPLALEAGAVPGLPDRAIPLDELQAILLHPSTPYRTRDAAIRVLLARAQEGREQWLVGLAGVLLPGLRRATAVLREVCPGKAADIEAEAIAGLIEGVAATNAGRQRLAARLTWLARNRAKRLVAAELCELANPGRAPASDPPARPYGHPDFVLAEAVAAGVLLAEDAALIGDTRLGLFSMSEAAVILGLALNGAYSRRSRAERQLVAWLCQEDRFAGKAAISPYSAHGGRPRLVRSNDRPPAACKPPTDPRR